MFNWKRLNALAIGEIVATLFFAIFALVLFKATYRNFYLQKYLSEGLKLYYSGGEDNINESLEFGDKAEATDPNNSALHNLYGAIYSHPTKGDVGQAKDHYEKALEFNSTPHDRYVSYLSLGILNMQKASAPIKKKKKSKKKHKKHKRRKKLKSRNKALFTEAEDFFEKAQAVSGNKNPDGLFYKWILYSVTGQSSKAKGALKEVETILKDPEQVMPARSTLVSFYYQRSRALAGKGHYKKACKYLRRAFRLDPTLETIPKLLARYLHQILDRGWEKSSTTMEKKLEDITYVESFLLLGTGSARDSKGSLLGLDSHRALLNSQLGLAYGKLADAAAKRFGWRKNFTGLNQELMRKLKQRRGNRADLLLKKGLDQIIQSLRLLGRRRRSMDYAFSLFYQAQMYRIWIRHIPANVASSHYLTMMNLYVKLANMDRTLEAPLRRDAFTNAAYCAAKLKRGNSAHSFALSAMALDRGDPRPLINGAIPCERRRNTRQWAYDLYKEALTVFQKNPQLEKDPSMKELKRQVAGRLQFLREKYHLK